VSELDLKHHVPLEAGVKLNDWNIRRDYKLVNGRLGSAIVAAD